MSIPAMYVNGLVSFLLDGKMHQINEQHKNYKKIMKALKELDAERLIRDLLNDVPEVSNAQMRLGKLVVDGDNVTFNGEPVHEVVKNGVQDFLRKEIPLNYIERFLSRLEQNPSFNSRKQLFSFIQAHGLFLTEDGCFLAYKVVQNNFMDKYSSTIDNTPGQTVFINREKVDDNPNNHCSKGLHVGGLQYIMWYGNASSDRIVIVKVDPKDAVSVPNDSNFLKLRVCKYEVLEEYQESLKDILYTSQGKSMSSDVDDSFDVRDVFSTSSNKSVDNDDKDNEDDYNDNGDYYDEEDDWDDDFDQDDYDNLDEDDGDDDDDDNDEQDSSNKSINVYDMKEGEIGIITKWSPPIFQGTKVVKQNNALVDINNPKSIYWTSIWYDNPPAECFTDGTCMVELINTEIPVYDMKEGETGVITRWPSGYIGVNVMRKNNILWNTMYPNDRGRSWDNIWKHVVSSSNIFKDGKCMVHLTSQPIKPVGYHNKRDSKGRFTK